MRASSRFTLGCAYASLLSARAGMDSNASAPGLARSLGIRLLNRPPMACRKILAGKLSSKQFNTSVHGSAAVKLQFLHNRCRIAPGTISIFCASKQAKANGAPHASSMVAGFLLGVEVGAQVVIWQNATSPTACWHHSSMLCTPHAPCSSHQLGLKFTLCMQCSTRAHCSVVAHFEHEYAQHSVQHHIIHVYRLPEALLQGTGTGADHLVCVLRGLSCKCAGEANADQAHAWAQYRRCA